MSWMLSPSLEVTDEWVVFSLMAGHHLFFSVDIQPVVLSVIVSQALTAFVSQLLPQHFGIKSKTR